MDQDILNTILNDTFSLSQLNHRLRILKSNLLKKLFGGEAENLTLSTQDLDWLKSQSSDFYQKFNKDNVYQIFSQIEKEIAKLPTLTMYLTFEADEATLAQIGTFARKTFGLPLILNIKLDPTLIAGTALVWKGVIRDYSLRTKIESKKAEILEEFKKFLR